MPQQLRGAMTGAGILDCRRALLENDGDMEKAVASGFRRAGSRWGFAGVLTASAARVPSRLS